MVGLIGKMPQITTTQVWKLKRPFLFYLEHLQGHIFASLKCTDCGETLCQTDFCNVNDELFS